MEIANWLVRVVTGKMNVRCPADSLFRHGTRVYISYIFATSSPNCSLAILKPLLVLKVFQNEVAQVTKIGRSLQLSTALA